MKNRALDNREIVFLGLRPNDILAVAIEKAYCRKTGEPELIINNLVEEKVFSNTEPRPRLRDAKGRYMDIKNTEWRDKKVYLVQNITSQRDIPYTHCLVGMIADALYLQKAKEVNLIAAYHFFGRQDDDPSIHQQDTLDFDLELTDPERIRRKNKLRGQTGCPWTLRWAIRNHYNWGIKKVIDYAKHSEKTPELYKEIYGHDRVYYELDYLLVLSHYLRFKLPEKIDLGTNGSKLVFSYPDQNACKNGGKVIKLTGYSEAGELYGDKHREKPNDPNALDASVCGQSRDDIRLEGMVAVEIDDIAETLGTACKNSETIIQQYGPPAYLFGLFGHVGMTEDAYTNIYKHRMNMFGSNTHPNIIYHWEQGAQQMETGNIANYLVNGVLECTEKARFPSEVFRFNKDNLHEFGENYEIIREGQFIPYLEEE